MPIKEFHKVMLSIEPVPLADRESQVKDRGIKYLIHSLREKQNAVAYVGGQLD